MAVKAYLCIGGELDGKYVKSTDFQGAPYMFEWTGGAYGKGKPIRIETGPPGIYERLRSEYHQYNCGAGRKRKHSMVWIHKSLLER